jgi:hypothetical protein
MIKTARFTTGARIENHFLDLLESIYTAYYAKAEKKSDLLIQCIRENDLIVFLLQTAYEAKLIKQSHYAQLSDTLYEIGKMLGGWKNNSDVKKQNTPQ